MEVVASKLNRTQALTEFGGTLSKDQIAFLQTLLTSWHMESNRLRQIKSQVVVLLCVSFIGSLCCWAAVISWVSGGLPRSLCETH